MEWGERNKSLEINGLVSQTVCPETVHAKDFNTKVLDTNPLLKRLIQSDFSPLCYFPRQILTSFL